MQRKPYEKPAAYPISAALLALMITTMRPVPGLNAAGHVWMALGTCPECRKGFNSGGTCDIQNGKLLHAECVRLVVTA